MTKNNYTQFASIDVFETGLIEKYARNRNFLKRNGIESLADLFMKDDEGSIAYSYPTFTITDNDVKVLIAFARCKFLGDNLDFGIDPFEKHNRDYWFYTQDEVTKLNMAYAKTGTFLGNNVKKESVKNIKLIGVDIEMVLIISDKLRLGERLSLADIFTNEAFIDYIKKSYISDVQKNCILIVSAYLKRISLEREDSIEYDSQSVTQEKIELLNRLKELEQERASILKRLEQLDSYEPKNKSI